jgi:DMSO/TMAO reductase YedYZ molybdopterin-dependent catalytic subunit
MPRLPPTVILRAFIGLLSINAVEYGFEKTIRPVRIRLLYQMHSSWHSSIRGALAGLFLTPPLAAIFYAGHALAGLPFVPFSIFDWITRITPGPLLSVGIDTMVRLIRALHLGSTSAAAKTAEQAMAIIGFVIAGMVFGAILFALLRGRETICLLAGGLAGIAALLIDRSVAIAATYPVADAIWILALFLLWGAGFSWVYRRWAAASVEVVDRRRFLIQVGGAAAIVTVVGAVLGKTVRRGESAARAAGEFWSSTHPLPNADAAVKPAPGTRAELTPVPDHYRIDINAVPPVVNEAAWRLKVGGLVEQPLAYTLDQLRGYEASHQFITLSCISNLVGGDLIGTTRWTGVSLKRLLPEFKLRPNATHLKIYSADGFYEVVPIEAIHADDRLMLAYAWDGVPLTAPHGFPLRIYIPDRYGMKQPKWIDSIEATDHWEPGYWVVRGWDREARMKATSVIDTIAVNMMIGNAGQGMRVPVGGIAHAGVRGVSKVEISVDGGAWQPAELRTPLSGQTWVIWRYDWPIQKGKHTLTVRCFDGAGTPQIVEEAPPHPSGATGLNTRSAML